VVHNGISLWNGTPGRLQFAPEHRQRTFEPTYLARSRAMNRHR